jgi:hypothetical protein
VVNVPRVEASLSSLSVVRCRAGRGTGRGGGQARFPATGGGVLIATTARWHYTDPTDVTCDVMIVDEAWQATYADVGALGALTAPCLR